MEPCKDLATIDKPLTVNHETLKIYSALKSCMVNNEELRAALLDAVDTINKLTKALNESQS